MNTHGHMHCSPKKNRKKKCPNKKIGIIMLALGIITIMALFLPLHCWVILLCIALIVFGIMLLKK